MHEDIYRCCHGHPALPDELYLLTKDKAALIGVQSLVLTASLTQT